MVLTVLAGGVGGRVGTSTAAEVVDVVGVGAGEVGDARDGFGTGEGVTGAEVDEGVGDKVDVVVELTAEVVVAGSGVGVSAAQAASTPVAPSVSHTRLARPVR